MQHAHGEHGYGEHGELGAELADGVTEEELPEVVVMEETAAGEGCRGRHGPTLLH